MPLLSMSKLPLTFIGIPLSDAALNILKASSNSAPGCCPNTFKNLDESPVPCNQYVYTLNEPVERDLFSVTPRGIPAVATNSPSGGVIY